MHFGAFQQGVLLLDAIVVNLSVYNANSEKPVLK